MSSLMQKIVNHPFSQFNRQALKEEESQTLNGGIKKHTSVLAYIVFFIPFQIMLCVIAPEIFILLSAMSFIVLGLMTAWYTITFQNVSAAQLVAGVADFITHKMFRAFMLSFSTLIIGTIVFLVKMLLPELAVPPITDIFIGIRIFVLVMNIAWILMLFLDVYFASVAYDAADSLLGDGFPTIMRGAKANLKNSPMVLILAAIAKKIDIDVDAILNNPDKDL